MEFPRTRQMKRTQRILQAVGVTVYPESWYSFEMQVEVGEGFNVPEAKIKHPRNGKDVNGLRSHQAVACKKRCTQELGKPHILS